jgi:Flp pilus assembly protein TadD
MAAGIMKRLLAVPGLALAILASGCQPAAVRPGSATLEDVVALRQQAEQAYAAEDWPAAEKAYHRLTETVPQDAENWFRLGNVYARLGRHQEAIALYREALVRDPAHARAWHNLGMTQLRVATGTFVEMQAYTDPEDPVVQRARRIVEAIEHVLGVEETREGGEQP